MGKEKFIRKRKSADKFTFKQSIMLGVVIIASVSIIFMQADNASAAKKKTKQDNHYVTMSFKNGVLTVKGNGEMGDPINITVYEGKNIKKVVIKKGVVSLPDNAFKDCKKLKKIVLPSTLKRIGARAFSNTTALESLNLPNGIKTIKEYTFEKSGIEKVNIPKTVKKIGAYAFEGCPIKNISIPKSVKSIEPGAFAGSSIKSITIPKTVKKLGEGVFGNCKKLESITMPGNIGVIKYEIPDYEYQPKSFVGDSCKSLKKIKFTTSLNINILKRVGKSGGFEVMANDPKYKSVDGLIYSKDGKTLLRIPHGRKKVIISDKCTTVTAGSYGYEMYLADSAMKEIVFPKTVTKIILDDTLLGPSYYECNNIKITLNMDYLDDDSIKILWQTNKYWRNSLKDELLRKGLAKLNEENERMLMLDDGYLCAYLMKDISKIDDRSAWETIDGLVVPDNVKTIGTEAFTGFLVKSLTFGSGVKYVEENVLLAADVPNTYKNMATIYVKNHDIVISKKAFDANDQINIVMA